MPMTVVATRNVSDRIRGFLASSMIELTPGVYSAPRLSTRVRRQIWSVLEEWWLMEANASVVMVWSNPAVPGGQAALFLGAPPIQLVELDGLVVGMRRPSE